MKGKTNKKKERGLYFEFGNRFFKTTVYVLSSIFVVDGFWLKILNADRYICAFLIDDIITVFYYDDNDEKVYIDINKIICEVGDLGAWTL